MAINIRDALNMKLEDVPAPALAPAGTYRFRISKQPEWGEAGNGRFETLDFRCQAIEPVTVDDDEIAEFGDVKAINLSRRFMFNTDPAEENARARTLDGLNTFLQKHLGMDPELTLAEAIDQCVGQEFLGEVGHRANPENPERPFVDLKRTAPLA